jgi:electron transfer flavoprotein beta subunit
MRAVVCVKQIPDPESAAEATPNTSWLVPGRADILDDTDRYGIELGLQLAGDANTTLVSLGAATSEEGLRQGFAMGAESGVLIRQDPHRGADALVTARALSAAIAQQGFDLVITGTASADGSAGVMSQLLGELLGVPAISDVTRAEVSGDTLTVHRQTAAGHEVLSCALPAVIAVTAGAVEPRFPSIRGSMKAKRKQITRREVGELLPDWADAAARMPQIIAAEPAEAKPQGRRIEDDGSAHLAVVALLDEQGVI